MTVCAPPAWSAMESICAMPALVGVNGEFMPPVLQGR